MLSAFTSLFVCFFKGFKNKTNRPNALKTIHILPVRFPYIPYTQRMLPEHSRIQMDKLGRSMKII